MVEKSGVISISFSFFFLFRILGWDFLVGKSGVISVSFSFLFFRF